jgi:hypothetical protein
MMKCVFVHELDPAKEQASQQAQKQKPGSYTMSACLPKVDISCFHSPTSRKQVKEQRLECPLSDDGGANGVAS